jgi:hypothetical protein
MKRPILGRELIEQVIIERKAYKKPYPTTSRR